MKFRVNKDYYLINKNKITYLFNRLRNNLQKYIKIFLNINLSNSFKELLNQFKRQYIDLLIESIIYNKYTTLKQINKDLPTFLEEFYKLIIIIKISKE